MISGKKRVAVIKYGGLTAGGTEKLLQIIAANLPKKDFDVTFFWCDPAPLTPPNGHALTTSIERMNFLELSNIKLVQFNVDFRDLSTPTHVWRKTDFFKFFNENNFDVVLTSLAGHKEYPFTKILTIPIVEIIGLQSGSDNQYNISRVLHLCRWSADGWIKRGGDPSRVEIVSLPIEINGFGTGDYIEEFGLREKFVFGMHQRPDDAIFSPIPLEAYSKIESNKTAYVLMGGGEKYRNQAKELRLKNVYFLPASPSSVDIGKFLRTLNVFAHGRADGEVNSQAMAEAMYFGLPIISHFSFMNNGHVENIGSAGRVLSSVDEYASEMLKLSTDHDYYLRMQNLARERFAEHYELEGQIKHYSDILKSVVEDPFPRPIKRRLWSLHWRQNIRVCLVWVYYKLRKFGFIR